MKNLVQTQKVTLIDLNDKNNVKIRIFYYILGGLFEFSRERKATENEILEANNKPTGEKRWALSVIYLILKLMLMVFMFSLVAIAIPTLIGAIYFFFTQEI